MSSPGQRTPWIVAAVIVAAALLVGGIDLAHTEGKLRPYPALCVRDTAECNHAREAKIVSQVEGNARLDRDFDRRAWLYGGVAALAMALATAVALARSPSREGRRRVFASAGVAGVVLGFAGVVLLGVLSAVGRGIGPPDGAVFLPCLTLVAVAGIGGSFARLRAPAADGVSVEPPAADGPRLGRLRWVARAALLCTGLTVVLVWVFAAGQHVNCDVPSASEGTTTPLEWAALASAGAGGVLGLVGLAARRWFVALLCFVVNPTAVFFMGLSGGGGC